MAARYLFGVVVFVGLCTVALGFEGKATFYYPAMGACGKVNTKTEMVMAISHVQYGEHSNPNKAPVCGKCALVKAVDSGEQVKVKVVDRCEGCDSGSIDLSPAAFEKLADKDLGHIEVTWNYVKC
ncbi:papain inhibitor-like [Paramacrobiotus metropolitanus]|uniref:papain inhibitor-like n=1 Tax=Paramacrobiotus metropolitanus TaxID=2943436 RepID=UPI0024462EBD|nr:papain inhibitor-like [Paramacrobiotus metropolitanus]